MFAGDNLWYSLLDEAFVVHDQDVKERFAIGFAPALATASVMVSESYTLQLSRNAITGTFDTADNIFRFRIKQYLNKAKPSRVEGVSN